MGRDPGRGRLQAARDSGPRHGQGGRRPSHRDREQVQRGRGTRDSARDLPLSPQRQRLERHRLQRARRPVRQPLRRASRRAEEGGGRRARPGLQLPDHRRGVDRHAHGDRDLAGGEGVACRLSGVEALRARPARNRQDDPDLSRRRGEPLPTRPQGAPQQDHRPPHGRAHRVSRRAPIRRGRKAKAAGRGRESSRAAGRSCRPRKRFRPPSGSRPRRRVSRHGRRERTRRARARPRAAHTRHDHRPARACGRRARCWRSRA